MESLTYERRNPDISNADESRGNYVKDKPHTAPQTLQDLTYIKDAEVTE